MGEQPERGWGGAGRICWEGYLRTLMVTLLAETSDMRALRGTGFPGDGEAPVSGGVEPAGRDEAGGSLHISGSCWDHTVALGHFYLIFFCFQEPQRGGAAPLAHV